MLMVKITFTDDLVPCRVKLPLNDVKYPCLTVSFIQHEKKMNLQFRGCKGQKFISKNKKAMLISFERESFED